MNIITMLKVPVLAALVVATAPVAHAGSNLGYRCSDYPADCACHLWRYCDGGTPKPYTDGLPIRGQDEDDSRSTPVSQPRDDGNQDNGGGEPDPGRCD